MQGYFCISSTGREFLYLPFNLFGYNSLRSYDLNFLWEPDVLAKITLLLKEGKLSRERLEDKSWEIHEVDIPDKFVKKFRRLCEKKSQKRCLNLASRIFSWIEDSYDSMEMGGSSEDENCPDKETWDSQEDRDYYDYEDYQDDWWLRGEDPPFARKDEQ